MSKPAVYALPPPGPVAAAGPYITVVPTPLMHAHPHDPSAYAQPPLQPHPHDHDHHHHDQPSRSTTGEWLTGFCSCCSPMSTCCLGAFCPCVLYGRTHHRLQSRGGTLEGYSCCNASCCFYCCLIILSPMQVILGYMQRRKIRHTFGLRGGCCGDCMRHCCCACCALVQEEKEVVAWSRGEGGYQRTAGMEYGVKR